MINEPKTPWLANYGTVPFYLEYPDCSMWDAVNATAEKHPNLTALTFMGRKIKYKKLAEMVRLTARAFIELGVKPGDRVTLCMPNIPQTVYCLYALNSIGALASMIHPLSAEAEIAFYIKETESRIVVTLDRLYPRLCKVRQSTPFDRLVIANIVDELDFLKGSAFRLVTCLKPNKIKTSDATLRWLDFLKKGLDCAPDDSRINTHAAAGDAAVILFSGGTTGKTKGILLSNLNFNSLAVQTATMCNCDVTGKSMLAAMPMFHGFGLGVCVHTMMVAGGQSILVPRFTPDEYAALIKKQRPNFIAGVPTLFEAITRSKCLDGVRLDCLKGVFSGGDSLSCELKKKIDAYLADHNATVRVREGYGTTECVTASCLTPYHIEKEGSIGVPYPDTYYMICGIGSVDELPYGTDGEICLCGPSVMIGYLNNPEETAACLRRHADGHIWLHTGDLGMMDSEGFIYFKQRIKRMIITSGYNVYPSNLENILDAHEAVQMSCVIGVKDDYKIQKVKAFVVLREGYTDTPELKASLMSHCKKNIAKYALPYAIEVRESLPKTAVGKIAYTVLEAEEAAKSNI